VIHNIDLNRFSSGLTMDAAGNLFRRINLDRFRAVGAEINRSTTVRET
jgi:hypothetical protein